MAAVQTTKIIDPRIQPQPEPVFEKVIGPRQSQYYKLDPSAKSESYVAFNNLTTLGLDRAYLDTFELYITATIEFKATGGHKPELDEWTFDSFPFAKCCDSVRVNVNGGNCVSYPLSYVRAKERYWCENDLSKSYENVCPVHKPHLQNETGTDKWKSTESDTKSDIEKRLQSFVLDTTADAGKLTSATLTPGQNIPSRLPRAQEEHYMPTPGGLCGGSNNSIVRNGTKDFKVERVAHAAGDYITRVTCSWREPIFCSPFSSRIDATWGRPLYNISSLDISFNLQNLQQMIRVAHLSENAKYVNEYDVRLDNVQLYYQVMTLPPTVTKPANTLVPYRRFTPYITDIKAGQPEEGGTVGAGTSQRFLSGTYTLNEIPQAIWVFVAPDKAVLQSEPRNGEAGGNTGEAANLLGHGNWINNKMFAFINKVSISLANTTQILDRAEVHDLYRIAKANGCCDSFENWGVWDQVCHRGGATDWSGTAPPRRALGVGSVLRLIPGVDILLPDQDLIPAANANNMVLQVEVDAYIPPHPTSANNWSLWLLFEYNGVINLTPGQCEITMNPVGTGEIFAAAPTISATSESTEGIVEGSGWLDKIKRAMAWLLDKKNKAKENKTFSKIQSAVGADSKIAPFLGWAADMIGENDTPKEPAAKKQKSASGGAVTGGAVMGLGDFC